MIKKYETEAYEAQEKKLQQVRENKVPREQPVKTLIVSNVPKPASD